MAPRTPKQNKALREESRQQIQQAAFELFAKNGFTQTTVSAIAKKAGISKGLIYHYFDSKKDILEGIFHYWIQATEYMLDFPDDWSAGKKMQKMLTDIFAFIKAQPETSRFITALALQPDAIMAIKSYLEKVNCKQIAIMEALLKELDYADPGNEAYYLGAKLDGITIGYLTLGKNYPLKAMKQKILEEYIPDEDH